MFKKAKSDKSDGRMLVPISEGQEFNSLPMLIFYLLFKSVGIASIELPKQSETKMITQEKS